MNILNFVLIGSLSLFQAVSAKPVNPIKDPEAKEAFENEYLEETSHKAFAYSKDGDWAWVADRTSVAKAHTAALRLCKQTATGKAPCRIVHSDDAFFTGPSPTEEPSTSNDPEQRLQSHMAASAFTDDYLKSDKHRAFAESPDGAWAWEDARINVTKAKEAALSACEEEMDEGDLPCQIVHVDDNWVTNP